MDTMLDALQSWIEAKAAADACRLASDYSYECQNEIDHEERTRQAVKAALAEVIDSRIEAATGARP